MNTLGRAEEIAQSLPGACLRAAPSMRHSDCKKGGARKRNRKKRPEWEVQRGLLIGGGLRKLSSTHGGTNSRAQGSDTHS